MPVYPKKGRGRNAWQVVIFLRGKRHDRTFHGKKSEAEAYEARLRTELEVGAVPDTRNVPTFSSFCVDRYKPHAKIHLRPSTWKNSRKYHLATLIGSFGPTKLTELTTEHVEAYKAQRRKSAGARTVNTELAVLCAVLSYARKLNVPCAKPAIVRLPVVGRGRVTFWSDEQVAALFAVIARDEPDLMGPVVFLANTGCRKGEAIAAQKSWINMTRKMIEIPVNEFWQPKDNEPREVPISAALLPWIERAMSTPGPYLFQTRHGGPHRWWPRERFDRARKAAKLRGGPHTLRHTFASHFLRAVPDLYLLAKVLGHSHERMSATYAHLLPTHLERAREAVNLGPAMGPAALEARRRWGAM
jgi:integrase